MQNTEINKDNTLSKEIGRMSDKKLSEVRNECISKLKVIQAKLKEENRPLTSEEDKQCSDLSEKIKMIDSTFKSRENIQNDYNKISEVLDFATESERVLQDAEPYGKDDLSSNQAYPNVNVLSHNEERMPTAVRSRTREERNKEIRDSFYRHKPVKDNFVDYLRSSHSDLIEFMSNPYIDDIRELAFDKVRNFLDPRKGRGALAREERMPTAVRSYMKEENLGGVIKKIMMSDVIRDLFESSYILEKCTLVSEPGTVQLPKVTGKFEMKQYTSGTPKEVKHLDTALLTTDPVLFSVAAGLDASLIKKCPIDLVGEYQAQLTDAAHRRLENTLVAGFNGESEGDGQQGEILGLTESDNVHVLADPNSFGLTDFLQIMAKLHGICRGSTNNKALDKCVWIMSQQFYIKLLSLIGKDGYSLVTEKKIDNFQPVPLMNCPVYCPDGLSMPQAGEVAAYFGDLSSLIVHVAEPFNIRATNEEFITMNTKAWHAYMEFDTRLMYATKMVKIKLPEE